MKASEVTIIKHKPGLFHTFHNGTKTKYHVVNRSVGLSVIGLNTYGIHDTESGKHTWIGSLAKTKKVVTHWINKENSKD